MDPKFRNLDFNPYKLPSEYLHAIGLVSASSAQTESVIQDAFAGLLKTDMEIGFSITTHMSAPLRDQSMRALAEIQITDIDTLDELDKLLDTIKDAMSRRNTIVHNQWCHDEETKEVFITKTSARGSVEVELIPMDIDAIRSDAKFIYEAGMNLMAFIVNNGIKPALPPVGRYRGERTKKARKARIQK